jgi:hypothetical protein
MVHVGANVGEELGVYLFLSFERILMVEANPAAIPALVRNLAALNALPARIGGAIGFPAGVTAAVIHFCRIWIARLRQERNTSAGYQGPPLSG